MKVTAKKTWLRALRGNSPNGEYDQCTGNMHEKYYEGGDAFCCLGVLRNETGGFDQNNECNNAYVDYETQLIPDELERFGITKGQMDKLIVLNDTRRYNFESIADWIEKNL